MKVSGRNPTPLFTSSGCILQLCKVRSCAYKTYGETEGQGDSSNNFTLQVKKIYKKN